MLGLCFCARAFSSCSERGLLFIVVHWPLTIVASLVVEHRLQTRRLSSCGSQAQLLRGMWDIPGPGLEPVSPALAGRFSTTAPPGKPSPWNFIFKGRGRKCQRKLPVPFPFFKKKNKCIYLFIYFWLRWVFVAAHGFSLVVVSRGCSSLRCEGFSLRWLLLLAEHRL